MVRSGMLRHRVIIQTKSSTRNALGERLDSWTEVATVWGNVRPVTGAEILRSDTEISTTDYLIRIRYRSDVTTSHRVQLEDGTTLDIQRVIDVNGRKRETELSCVARKPA